MPKLSLFKVAILSAWGGRAINIVSQLAVIRVLSHALSLEDFALSTLMLNLTAWFALFTFGIGSALQNYISECRAQGQAHARFVQSASLVALLIVPVVGVVLLLCAELVSANFFGSYVGYGNNTKARLFLVCGLIFVIQNLGQFQFNIWYGEQRGYLSSLVPAGTTVFGLLALYTLTQTTVHAHVMGCFFSLTIANAVVPFFLMLRHLPRSFSMMISLVRHECRLLFKRGFGFWGFAVLGVGVLQVDYLMISRYLSAYELVQYNILSRVFGVLLFAHTAILLSLWPVFSELIARHDFVQVKQVLKKYIALGLVLVALGSVAVVLGMPWVIHFLLPEKSVVIPVGLIVLMGVYCLIRVWTDTFGVLVQSANDMRPLWLLVAIQALLSIVAQSQLIPQIGLAGAILGLIISFLLTVTWALPAHVQRKYFKK